ncbi:UNVERIFIED_CONTAM: hypothetical protein GTU68_066424 [Idotea baltica]|nr:hypothetical protein [Idotea baltica]
MWTQCDANAAADSKIRQAKLVQRGRDTGGLRACRTQCVDARNGLGFFGDQPRCKFGRQSDSKRNLRGCQRGGNDWVASNGGKPLSTPRLSEVVGSLQSVAA